MTGDEWRWDDPRLVDDDRLVRRVPRRPSCLVIDPLTSQHQLKVEAFTYDSPPKVDVSDAGLSVSIGSIASDQGDVDKLVPWEDYGVAIFPLSVARSDRSGVVRAPTPEDVAHGLVRVAATTKQDRRKVWLPLRSRIRDHATYHDSPSSARHDLGPARTARQRRPQPGSPAKPAP